MSDATEQRKRKRIAAAIGILDDLIDGESDPLASSLGEVRQVIADYLGDPQPNCENCQSGDWGDCRGCYEAVFWDQWGAEPAPFAGCGCGPLCDACQDDEEQHSRRGETA